jgi:glyoxylase-like metal-dependent hydrolase (beta-lactamase superfamily II)
MEIRHLNCGILQAPGGPAAACHCLVLEARARRILVDTGVGVRERVPAQAVEAAGFQFHPHLLAVHQVTGVTDVVLTHADPDHAGGLADFPEAVVHFSEEEHAALHSGLERYSSAQFQHGPRWNRVGTHSARWFGLEARPVFADLEIFLVPLFGHTAGHCGVAIRRGEGWLLHVGDAYYLKIELSDEGHPIHQLTARNAVDDAQRRASLEELKRLAREHPEVEMVGYHDFSEFPT